MLLKCVWAIEALADAKSAGWDADEIEGGGGWSTQDDKDDGGGDVRLECCCVCCVIEDKSVASGVWPDAWW